MSGVRLHRSGRHRTSAADLQTHGIRVVRVAAGALAGLAIVTAASTPLTGVGTPSSTEAAQAAQAAQTAPARTQVADGIRAGQWWLGAIHGPGAWKWTRGAGVTVAVLDTGADGRHADLTGQIIQGPDYTTGGRAPGNRFWGRHGTLMASIIAGHGHGPGRDAGVMGVAPQSKVLSIRVTWENEDPIRRNHAAVVRNHDSVAKGIRYAVDHGAGVINMSLGGGRSLYDGNPVDAAAVKYALDKNVVLVASMGNDGATANDKNFPAAYPGVIAVGAVDRGFKPWKGSNHREYVSVAAPGKDIVGADDLGTHYSTGIGTSPSSAMVAGVAALIRSRYPKLTPDQVKQAIEKGTTHKPATGRSIWVGAGVLDAKGALLSAHRINKAANGATPAAKPKASPSVVGRPLNLLLVVILAGGGALVLVGLVLGWLQRRRPGDEWKSMAAEPVEPVAAFADLPPAAEPREPVLHAAPVSLPDRPGTAGPAPGDPAETSAFDPGVLQPYEVPVAAGGNGQGNGHGNGHGNGNGPRPDGRVDGFRMEDFQIGPAAGDTAPPPADRLRDGIPSDFDSDPLSADLGPLPVPEIDTPLADESWRSLLSGLDQPGDGVPRDGVPRDAVPRDGGPRDGGPRDGGSRDGGSRPPAGPSPDEVPTSAFPAVDPLTGPLTGPPSDPLTGPLPGLSPGTRADPLRDPLTGPLDPSPEAASNDEGDESFGRPARPRTSEEHPFGAPARPRDADEDGFRPPWW